jgi:hypothetical protein
LSLRAIPPWQESVPARRSACFLSKGSMQPGVTARRRGNLSLTNHPKLYYI